MSWRLLLKVVMALACVLIPGIAAAQSAIAGVARDFRGNREPPRDRLVVSPLCVSDAKFF